MPPDADQKPRLTIEQLTADIPAMPVVASRAMQELGDPDTNARKVAEIIAMDQAMTGLVLRLANSPVFGARRKIATVADALVVVGFSAMKGLIITVSTRGVFKSTGLLEHLLWEHSIGAAVAANAIARATGAMSPDQAFVGGLMHDIGRSVFAHAYRDEYEALFKRIYNENLPRLTLIEYESRILRVTHMELGRLVVEKWRLALDLAEMVAEHHLHSAERLAALAHPGPVAVIDLANRMCCHLGIGLHSPDTSEPLFDAPSASWLRLTPEKIAGLLEKVTELFEQEKATFNI